MIDGPVLKTFRKDCKVHKCCASDYSRPVLNNVFFDNGYIVATDGHILVRVKLTEISELNEEQIALLNGKFLHGANYGNLLKYNFMQIEDDGIIAFNDSYSKIKFMFIQDETNPLKFPNYKTLLKDAFSLPTEQINGVSINPKNLLRIVEAIPTSEAPKLFLRDGLEAIGVGFYDCESLGLIMPCQLYDLEDIKKVVEKSFE